MIKPDKIYLTSTPYRILDGWCDSKTPYTSGIEQIEYISKDALLKWANEELEKRRNTGDDYFYPAIVMLNDLIDKLNSL